MDSKNKSVPKGLVRRDRALFLGGMKNRLLTNGLRWSAMLTVLTALLFAAGCGETEVPETTGAADSVVVEIVAVDSATVLAVTEALYDVESRSTAMGSFVMAIDTIRAGGEAFWIYSVNYETPGVAADKFDVGPGDTVRWHFRTGR